MPPPIGVLGLGIVLALASFEMLALLVWWPWFYRHGPRLWTVCVGDGSDSTPELAIAEAANSGSWRPLVFRRLSTQDVAFRESLIGFRPAVGLVGLIRQDATTVTVTTRCSWLLTGLAALATADVIASRDITGIWFPVLVVGLFGLQRYRLSVILRALAVQHDSR
jgi:hypothetical protein